MPNRPQDFARGGLWLVRYRSRTPARFSCASAARAEKPHPQHLMLVGGTKVDCGAVAKDSRAKPENSRHCIFHPHENKQGA